MTPFVPLQKTINLRRGYVDDNGKQHRECTIRAPRADDEIKADAEVAQLRLSSDPAKRAEALSDGLQALALAKQCCVKLGDIMAPSLTVFRKMGLRDSQAVVGAVYQLADEDGKPPVDPDLVGRIEAALKLAEDDGVRQALESALVAAQALQGAEGNGPTGSPGQ